MFHVYRLIFSEASMSVATSRVLSAVMLVVGSMGFTASIAGVFELQVFADWQSNKFCAFDSLVPPCPDCPNGHNEDGTFCTNAPQYSNNCQSALPQPGWKCNKLNDQSCGYVKNCFDDSYTTTPPTTCPTKTPDCIDQCQGPACT